VSETDEKILVAAPAAAKMLDMGKSTFWKNVKAGKLPQPIHIGGLTRWRVSDLLRVGASPTTTS
jgi:predicted DNA-binding transcriptional regulator AlpA